MTRTERFTLLLAVGLLAAGCSDEYGHEQVGGDSPEAVRVNQMLRDLREAGEAGLDGILARDGAGGLDANQTTALRATLRTLVEADKVELERLDRFGENVLRASFGLTADGKTTELYVLLVVTEDETFRWAGRN